MLSELERISELGVRARGVGIDAHRTPHLSDRLVAITRELVGLREYLVCLAIVRVEGDGTLALGDRTRYVAPHQLHIGELPLRLRGPLERHRRRCRLCRLQVHA